MAKSVSTKGTIKRKFHAFGKPETRHSSYNFAPSRQNHPESFISPPKLPFPESKRVQVAKITVRPFKLRLISLHLHKPSSYDQRVSPRLCARAFERFSHRPLSNAPSTTPQLLPIPHRKESKTRSYGYEITKVSNHSPRIAPFPSNIALGVNATIRSSVVTATVTCIAYEIYK